MDGDDDGISNDNGGVVTLKQVGHASIAMMLAVALALAMRLRLRCECCSSSRGVTVAVLAASALCCWSGGDGVGGAVMRNQLLACIVVDDTGDLAVRLL